MNRSVEITENSFFSILSDAVLLYDLATQESNKHIRSTLSKSSILSVNYALKAAANSFLTSINLNSKIKDQVDKFSTLDKFDFILQWHKNASLPCGDKVTQRVKKLIDQRNKLVHPKVRVITQEVITTSGNENIAYYRKAVHDESKEKCQVTKISTHPSVYSSEDSLIALKSLVNFLNKFVEI